MKKLDAKKLKIFTEMFGGFLDDITKNPEGGKLELKDEKTN